MLGQVTHTLLMYVQRAWLSLYCLNLVIHCITVAKFSFAVDAVDAQEFEFHSEVPTVTSSKWVMSS